MKSLKKPKTSLPFDSDPRLNKPTLEELAIQQGVFPVQNFDDLLGNFWPEEETADDFINAVEEWRREE